MNKSLAEVSSLIDAYNVKNNTNFVLEKEYNLFPTEDDISLKDCNQLTTLVESKFFKDMKHKVLLFVLLSIIGLNKGVAYDFEADGIYYNILSEDSLYVEVTKGDSLYAYEGDIVIPKNCEYNNKVYIVKSIGKEAFYLCTKLTNVVIPEGVTDIKDSAFSWCKGLQSISLPSTLITVERYAFGSCEGLTSVSFGKSIRAIGDRAFEYCENLKTINVPDIGTWCQIKFDNTYSNPLLYAKNLYINQELAENIIIPDYINSINPYAFEFCESLKSVVLPLSIKEIGRYAFHDCVNLQEINFPPNLTKIPHGGFSGSGLVHVKVGSNITIIEEDGFSYCANLKTIDIDAQTIYMEGVMNCYSLNTIIFRENVKNIMSYSFEDCPQIKDVYCYNMNPPQCYKESFSFYSNPTLHIPIGTLEDYKSKYGWYYFHKIIEDIELDSSGIEDLECEDNENIKIYDLNGHIIESDINSIRPGIYIVNNKKIFIR